MTRKRPFGHRDPSQVRRLGVGLHRAEVHGQLPTLSQPWDSPKRPVIGWREWVALPDLKIERIKAKVDTGARSSSLHASDIRILVQTNPIVQFKVHPMQGDSRIEIQCESPLLEQRWVRSSNGKRELRPVIRTRLALGAESWAIDVTLTSRDSMGFRMLLGREAVRRRFNVDPGSSYIERALVPRKGKKKSPQP